jgi:hypothetical protein
MAYDDIVVAGKESKLIDFMLRSSTTGAGVTGIDHAAITYSYYREGAAAAIGTPTACADLATIGTWETAAAKEVDATKVPGLYQFGIPNAALLTGAEAVTFMFASSGCLTAVKRILITQADLRSANLPVNVVTVLGLAPIVSDDLAVAATVTDIRSELEEASGALLPAIQTQVNKMNFNLAGDIKATLDGESVDVETVLGSAPISSADLPTVVAGRVDVGLIEGLPATTQIAAYGSAGAPTVSEIRSEIEEGSGSLLAAVNAKTEQMTFDSNGKVLADAGVVNVDVPTVEDIRAEMEKAGTKLTLVEAKTSQLTFYDGVVADLWHVKGEDVMNSSITGLSYRGDVVATPGANQFVISTLIGLGSGMFVDTNSPWYALVLRDATGSAIEPQGQMKKITVYDSATGTFTTEAFSPAVGTGDTIVIFNPLLAKPVVTVSDKTGFKLASDGVDAITSPTALSALAKVMAQTDKMNFDGVNIKSNAPSVSEIRNELEEGSGAILPTLATEANATANRGTVVTAISDKAVTPVTDISSLALETSVQDIKNKTEQMIFDSNGNIVANAGTVEIDATGLALEATAQLILSKANLIPASPAAVGSEMKLESSYNAAKTAATQASVNLLPSASDIRSELEEGSGALLPQLLTSDDATTLVNSRLAAGDYIAPDNTNIVNIHNIVKSGGTGDNAAIKVKTDNLPNVLVASQADVQNIDVSGISLNIHTDSNGNVYTVQDSKVDDIKAVSDKLDDLIENSSGNRFTEKALEQAPSELGSGAVIVNYTVYGDETAHTNPIANVNVWVTIDSAGNTIVASGKTNDFGVVIFYLNAGTYYFWRKKSGWDFINPDTEIIS